jgi:hypothetical protein
MNIPLISGAGFSIRFVVYMVYVFGLIYIRFVSLSLVTYKECVTYVSALVTQLATSQHIYDTLFPTADLVHLSIWKNAKIQSYYRHRLNQ